MSNKRRGHAGDGGEKRSRRLKHLYLVLDDWTKGYSIHKIQADSFDSDSDSDDQHSSAARHLPEPPALRLECPVGPVPHSGMSFSALGTNIFTFMNQRCSLIYDTKTAALAIGAHAPADMVCGFGITVVIGLLRKTNMIGRWSDKSESTLDLLQVGAVNPKIQDLVVIKKLIEHLPIKCAPLPDLIWRPDGEGCSMECYCYFKA